ncbi:MAG: methyltransferase domain-containing protein [Pseudobdellovibrionaceae bacterium]
MTASLAVEQFDKNALEYDKWFDEHPAVFKSELKALEVFFPKSGVSLEVGAGTGRFTKALDITYGLEPSPAMREIAKSRGIKVMDGVAEALPYPDSHFDSVVFVTTLCFVDDLTKALKETYRVLKTNGVIVTGIIDKDSTLGKQYQKSKSPFYTNAHFISAVELEQRLLSTGFQEIKSCQTLVKDPKTLLRAEEPISGHGLGGFIVFCGKKSGLGET